MIKIDVSGTSYLHETSRKNISGFPKNELLRLRLCIYYGSEDKREIFLKNCRIVGAQSMVRWFLISDAGLLELPISGAEITYIAELFTGPTVTRPKIRFLTNFFSQASYLNK